MCSSNIKNCLWCTLNKQVFLFKIKIYKKIKKQNKIFHIKQELKVVQDSKKLFNANKKECCSNTKKSEY